ncbi:MAG TPA: YfiR family protein [Casimicrobiaceae bacterium]
MTRNPRIGAAARLLLVAIAACLPALAATRARAQTPSVESAVKATYLYKFAPFVEWPAGTFKASDPLVICVVGSDPVADLVDEAVNGQAVLGHPIEVVHLAASSPEARCHILYVARRGTAAASAIERVRGKPVLTVTDAANEVRATGIVNFVVQDNRVRFEIDLRAAAENHLVVSSKLLNLASRVSPKP